MNFTAAPAILVSLPQEGRIQPELTHLVIAGFSGTPSDPAAVPVLYLNACHPV